MQLSLIKIRIKISACAECILSINVNKSRDTALNA